MTATHYNGSKGPVEIAKMAYPHLKAALAKLQRERTGDARQAEVDAMSARLAVLEEEHAQTEGAEPAEAPAPAAQQIEPNPREIIGGNNPPADRPFDAIKAHLDDLLIEARNWADGAEIESQGQADEVNRLIEDLRQGETAADAERVKEKKPLDDAIGEIQDRYNAYIAPLKNKAPGKVPMAISALKAALTPFLRKLEAEKDRLAEAARKEAADKAAAAAEAARLANAGSDLAAREAAEDMIAAANQANAVARRAENDHAHAHGGVRATGLRSFFKPVMTDRKAALVHYATTQPEALQAFLQRLADQDVAAGKRNIPGFEVQEERRVA